MKLTIKVQAHDDDATHMCTLSPLAQALRKAVGLPRATFKTASRHEAFEQPTRLYARGSKWQIQCAMPPDVGERMKGWHATGELEPFTFEVEAFPVTKDNAALGEFIYPGFGGYYDRMRSAAARGQETLGV
jgi:hypothetical protein